MESSSREIPNTLNAPFAHPSVEEAERAFIRLMRRFPLSSQEVRAMVRVEMSPDTYKELIRSLSPALARPFEHVGPMQVMGIDYYVVSELPKGTWRVKP